MKTHSSGFSLLELLVSMVIGLFLLAGLFQVSQINQQASRLQNAQQYTQKNGRFVIDQLTYAIKAAGYSGFYENLSNNVDNLLNTPEEVKWDISRPIFGFNNVSSNDVIGGLTGFIPDTDVLVLKGMNSNIVPVINNIDTKTIEVSIDGEFEPKDVVIISDVDRASIFQISSITDSAKTSTIKISTRGNTPGNSALLTNDYNSNAEIAKYDLVFFYVKAGKNSLPALFKASLINEAGLLQLQETELTSDIENMQISYGIDNNDDQLLDGYSDASAIADWTQVISINLALLSSSNKDNIVPAMSSFSYIASRNTFVPDAIPSKTANKRLKRVFRTHVQLRNK